MLLTRKACYGLIAVKYLTDNAQKEIPLRAKDLAELYGIPEGTLAKTLQHLVKAGILYSRQGINGGYRLARDPQHVTVLDVIKASAEASRSPVRPMFDPFRTVHLAVETALGQLTIANL
jgi:Rrf2 family protein